MNTNTLKTIGFWQTKQSQPAFDGMELNNLIHDIRRPVHIIADPNRARLGLAGDGFISNTASGNHDYPLLASLPALYPEWLGDRSFCAAHGVRFPYIAGEMANGISTTKMVIAMAKAQMLGFFGAGGLGFPKVEAAVQELVNTLGHGTNWGVNLIHSPNESALEDRVADLLIKQGVKFISASAFMKLTPAVVRCAAAGLSQDSNGQIVRKHHLFAKISRPEVAQHFMSPPPADMLDALLKQGLITAVEAKLAAQLPVAEDITVESDSGGHTDNRPLMVQLPMIMAIRDELSAKYQYTRPIRVGAAGGLGTPGAVAAAFALGAAYVVTGSVNQASIESGLSLAGQAMLAQADMADVTMAPAADMFESGVKVQVLKRGTLFGMRSGKLYDIYHSYPSIAAIPAELRQKLERDVLHTTFDAIWQETREFWLKRDAAEVAKAEANPKHQLALVCRWYLGKASKWAIDGEADRLGDFQIWCGPAMGAFNRWAANSFLADYRQRDVVQIALNFLEGATVLTRVAQLRSYGLPIAAASFQYRPRRLG